MTEPTAGALRPAAGERYRDTVARLAGAQKSGKGAPAYSRFVNRKLGRLLAAAAFHLGLSPNTVTAVSGVFSFAAIIALATVRPSWWSGAVIVVLLVLGYALDAADGQLARLRGGGSCSGEWLDHMIDCAKISSLHMAVLISLYRFTDLDEIWYLVPMAFVVVAAVSFFAQILNEQLARNRGGPRGAATNSSASPVVSLLKIPTDYGLLCLVFILLGSAQAFVIAYSVLFVGSAGYLVLALVKWFGQMRALDRLPVEST